MADYTPPPFTAPSSWPAGPALSGSPVSGAEQLWGVDSGGNPAAMPLAGLRRPGLYNVGPQSLRKWRSVRNAVLAGISRATIAVVGDSTDAGAGAGTSGTAPASVGSKLSTPSAYLARGLVARGLPATFSSQWGDNAYYTSGIPCTLAQADPRLTLGTGWQGNPYTSGPNSAGGSLLFNSNASPGALTFTPPDQCNTCDVYYLDGTGSGAKGFTISDGTTSLAVAATTSNVLKKATLTSASLALNAYSITPVSGSGATYILGIDCYNAATKEVSVWNLGACAWDTSYWTAPAGATGVYSPLSALQFIAPSLTIIGLGVNDAYRGITSGTQTRLQSIITAAQASGDVLLKTPVPAATSFATAANQLAVQQAHYALAQSLGLPLIDLSYRFVNWADVVADGYNAGDNIVHQNAKGYADTGNALADLLMGV